MRRDESFALCVMLAAIVGLLTLACAYLLLIDPLVTRAKVEVRYVEAVDMTALAD